MIYFCAISFVFLFYTLSASAEDYHWPMDAPPALTSTFGEYRGGRLHAAIDLKTWGKEGYPVTAVADGHVWRVRTSPWGYGRVVYVQLDNGRFALWAHLSGFSKRIEQYVQQEQARRGAYSVNLYFRPDQLPVKRGEIVGYSGSTGIGVPHLHFEMRDADHRPINPLLHGFDIEDALPPTLQAIGLAPLDADARVNAGHNPASYPLTWRAKEKQFTHPDTAVIWGRVGIGVKVFDRANASQLTNRLAPYRTRLLVDGKDVFQKTLGQFGYDVTRHGELAYDFFMSRRGLGRFHSLYRKPGNHLPFYGDSEIGEGVLFAGTKPNGVGHELAPGVHRVQVIAEDVKGNRAEAVLVVRVAKEPTIQTLKAVWSKKTVQVQARVTDAHRVAFEQSVNGGKTWTIAKHWRDVQNTTVQHTLPRAPAFRIRAQGAGEAFQTFAAHSDSPQITSEVLYFPTFALVRIKADQMLTARPKVRARFSKSQGLAVRQTDLQTYEALIAFDEKHTGDIEVQIEVNGQTHPLRIIQQTATKQGGEIRSDDGMARARFGKEGVYETLYGRIVPDTLPTDERVVGTAYRLMPEDVAFQEAEIAFVYPRDHPDVDKLGIYKWNERKGWIFVDMGRDSTLGAVTGKVKHFGLFALLIDNVPPKISNVFPPHGAVLSSRRPKVVADVKDRSSGIWRDEDIAMRIDNEALIVEYDPEENRMVARPRTPLTPGSHQLEIVVRDISGNESRRTTTFRIK